MLSTFGYQFRLLRHTQIIGLRRLKNNAYLTSLNNHSRGFSYSARLARATTHEETKSTKLFKPLDTFARRHIGPNDNSMKDMLETLKPPAASLDEFVRSVLPESVLSHRNLQIAGPDNDVEGYSESELLSRLRTIASKNRVFRSYIGCGYAGTLVPEVIKRNVLEGPGWYTAYTPYQPEISQGRLESLLNFQTLVCDLTGLAISNASLLDEATAAAEAMTLSMNALPIQRQKRGKMVYFVSHLVHPQTIAVLQSRAEGFGIELRIGDVLELNSQHVKDVGQDLIGVLAQYPDTEGKVEDFRTLSDTIHELGATFSVATDLLALTVLTPPSEFGADVAFGNAQRFGVSLGFGGPHAAFFACTEKNKRKIPGRLVGLSKDRLGDPAVRLALQTREQHIRREKATSNICTAQVLLANMSAFYAIYHGPNGLRRIAERIVKYARILDRSLHKLGFQTESKSMVARGSTYFDTVIVQASPEIGSKILDYAVSTHGINFRPFEDGRVGITIDETVSGYDLEDIVACFRPFSKLQGPDSVDDMTRNLDSVVVGITADIPEAFQRKTAYLTHPVFNSYHSETQILRYMHHLQSKDISLTHSMIPLGSCTMKLNATVEMAPVTWPEFASLHPFVPPTQAVGYATLIKELEDDLAHITGFAKVSLQPNSGAQGEFTALRIFRKYFETLPGKKRDICLIPTSAHGTNPASATMCGMRVVTIKCDTVSGNLDLEDLKEKCKKHSSELGAIMITYPSTFGVFEPNVKDACDLVHSHGGLVFMDGANLNAQIGLCSPAEIGADACHLNLHKTFCIPHGGGGPGVGPIGVTEKLAPYLPGHPLVKTGGERAIAPVSAAPWGSSSILPISWAYIKMMGGAGLTRATKVTLLNANYILSRLTGHYKILYTNSKGRCAHEFILDARPFKDTVGIEALDIAKRLQDYGFHAPTMSWPVANTLMIEPTESEPMDELDRFCDALISIRAEIKEVEDGIQPKEGNILKMAPHSQKDLLVGEWNRPYSREKAAYPLEFLKQKKFWPSVTRLDDAYGDTNLFCSCGPIDDSDQRS